MSKETSLTTLRRYSLFVLLASVFLAGTGIISLLLFMCPSIAGVDPDAVESYQGNIIWLVLGVLFVALSVFFSVTAYRWPRHLLRVLRTEPPTPMRLLLEVEEGSDSTQYYARLVYDSASGEGWRVGLWAPSREIRAWLGQELPVMVCFDSQTSEPVVIEHSEGYLWAMKGASLRLMGSGP